MVEDRERGSLHDGITAFVAPSPGVLGELFAPSAVRAALVVEYHRDRRRQRERHGRLILARACTCTVEWSGQHALACHMHMHATCTCMPHAQTSGVLNYSAPNCVVAMLLLTLAAGGGRIYKPLIPNHLSAPPLGRSGAVARPGRVRSPEPSSSRPFTPGPAPPALYPCVRVIRWRFESRCTLEVVWAVGRQLWGREHAKGLAVRKLPAAVRTKVHSTVTEAAARCKRVGAAQAGDSASTVSAWSSTGRVLLAPLASAALAAVASASVPLGKYSSSSSSM
eukprot:CAMPEP_0174696988 /NCGR_PEP_ID=MMETSP1094-20130205/2979_1 /TAXON_ID=156173 /ORGANISM="Chrysochromulina brevifilum, Strain UTEX LB 985" /LENGTH=279 /DNA_ID=CAMNT_0015893879 /DNA_START=382 /DNA_END=1222 /DNA_ORIENTATION=-